MRDRGVGDGFFHDVATEAEDLAADVRAGTLLLGSPPSSKIFAHVYSDPHPLMDAQRAWLAEYESGFEEGAE